VRAVCLSVAVNMFVAVAVAVAVVASHGDQGSVAVISAPLLFSPRPRPARPSAHGVHM